MTGEVYSLRDRIAEIAQLRMGVRSFKESGRDHLDFVEVSRKALGESLEDAYIAGMNHAAHMARVAEEAKENGR